MPKLQKEPDIFEVMLLHENELKWWKFNISIVSADTGEGLAVRDAPHGLTKSLGVRFKFPIFISSKSFGIRITVESKSGKIVKLSAARGYEDGTICMGNVMTVDFNKITYPIAICRYAQISSSSSTKVKRSRDEPKDAESIKRRAISKLKQYARSGEVVDVELRCSSDTSKRILTKLLHEMVVNQKPISETITALYVTHPAMVHLSKFYDASA